MTAPSVRILFLLAAATFSGLHVTRAEPTVILDEAESIAAVPGLTVSDVLVVSGKVSARWEAGRGSALSIPAPTDWTAFNLLRLHLHAGTGEEQTIVVNCVSDTPDTEGGDYYHYQLKLRQTGWQEAVIPLASFGLARSPRGWDQIDMLAFHSRGWGVEPAPESVIHIDRIELDYSASLAKRLKPKKRRSVQVNLPAWHGALHYVSFPWDNVFDWCTRSHEAEAARRTLVRDARKKAVTPIRKRMYSLEDLPENRRDGRHKYAGKNGEVFALAMSDCGDGGHLRGVLFPMAVAARCTEAPELRDYVVRQLRETATWSPLQRPGWTQYRAEATLPPGGDGNWLATGYSIRAIVDTLSVMGDRIPADLRENLRKLLQREVESVVDDWETKRPWFVRADYPATNQWALPSAALVYACLYLGDERNREAYELGIKNLARTCLSQGEDGSWHEGLSYGLMSAEYIFWAAWAAARNGDTRLRDFPFVRNYGAWVTNLTMPGRLTVNAFDCGTYRFGEQPHDSLLLAAMVSQTPTIYWACDKLFPLLPKSPLGLLFSFYSGDGTLDLQPPEPFAVSEGQQVLAWRSSWELDSAIGVWIRGGSTADSHSHRDNGHVSVINGKRPILIEAGTCSYSDPDLESKYAEAAGHNILQAAEQVRPRGRGCPTPLRVLRLDAGGGEATVDGTRAYTNAEQWERTISWESAGTVVIRDHAALLQDAKANTEWFRFHTGAAQGVTWEPTDRGAAATWEAATIRFQADSPIRVDPVQWPDRSGVGEHVCLRVRAVEAVRELALTTTVVFTPAVSRLAGLKRYADIRETHSIAGTGKPELIVLQAEDMIGDDTRFTLSDEKVGAKRCIYNWDHVGQVLETSFTIDEPGLYRVLVKCCTGANHGIPIRSCALDGVVPFREAANIVVRSTGGWSNETDDWAMLTLGEQHIDGGFLFPLATGEHTIRFVNEGGGGLNVDYVVLYSVSRAAVDVICELEPKRDQN